MPPLNNFSDLFNEKTVFVILKQVKQLDFQSSFKKENTSNIKVKLKNFSIITFSPILILINFFYVLLHIISFYSSLIAYQ